MSNACGEERGKRILTRRFAIHRLVSKEITSFNKLKEKTAGRKKARDKKKQPSLLGLGSESTKRRAKHLAKLNKKDDWRVTEGALKLKRMLLTCLKRLLDMFYGGYSTTEPTKYDVVAKWQGTETWVFGWGGAWVDLGRKRTPVRDYFGCFGALSAGAGATKLAPNDASPILEDLARLKEWGVFEALLEGVEKVKSKGDKGKLRGRIFTDMGLSSLTLYLTLPVLDLSEDGKFYTEAIAIAAEDGRVDTVNELLRTYRLDESALQAAIRAKSEEMVTTMSIRLGLGVKRAGVESLYLALRIGDKHLFNLACSCTNLSAADDDAKEKLVYWAGVGGNPDVLEDLKLDRRLHPERLPEGKNNMLENLGQLFQGKEEKEERLKREEEDRKMKETKERELKVFPFPVKAVWRSLEIAARLGHEAYCLKLINMCVLKQKVRCNESRISITEWRSILMLSLKLHMHLTTLVAGLGRLRAKELGERPL